MVTKWKLIEVQYVTNSNPIGYIMESNGGDVTRTLTIGALRQKLFGTGRGEKVDHAQLEIQLGLAEAQLTNLHAKSGEREDEAIDQLVAAVSSGEQEPEERAKRFSLPDNIEERTERIIPDEVMAAPDRYREIGEPEVTEIIDLEPARFIKIKQVFPRYVDKADRAAAPLTAPRPPRVLLGGLASVRLLVHVILAKYLEHMPLHRQEQSFKMRFGVFISRKTMGGWIRHVAEQWLAMIYESIKSDVRSSPYLGADETPITCLDSDYGKGSRKGYLWVYINREGECVYQWHMGRSAKCAQPMLAGYRGLLQSDAYKVYDSISAKEGFLQVGCMAHARRKFHEAWHDYDERASGWYILQIGELYKTERKLKENPQLDPVAVRQEESLPVLEAIKGRLDLDIQTLDQNTETYKAAAYALNHWVKLCRYVYDHDACIDNNAAERAVRPSKLGMKNWLFIGYPQAGQRTAIIYTIIQNCKNYGIDPQAYLNDVLQKLPNLTNKPEHIRPLLPKHWRKKCAKS
ncbi:IS66 family transposase [Coraliomargarita sp. W4R53]